jgi:hypothetical protein
MTGPIVNKPRKNVVAVRLTDDEKAILDARRGSKTQTEYMRALLLRDNQRQNDAIITIYEQMVAEDEHAAPDGSTVLPKSTL